MLINPLKSKNAFLINAYLPPYDSTFWNVTNNGYGLELLQKRIIDLHQNFHDFHLIICGGLNARTIKKSALEISQCILVMKNEDNDDLIF